MIPPGERLRSNNLKSIRTHIKMEINGKFSFLQSPFYLSLQGSLLLQLPLYLLIADQKVLASLMGRPGNPARLQKDHILIPVRCLQRVHASGGPYLPEISSGPSLLVDLLEGQLHPSPNLLRGGGMLKKHDPILPRPGQNIRIRSILPQHLSSPAQEFLRLSGTSLTHHALRVCVEENRIV